MWGIRRMRFAIGVDDDLRPFHDALPRRPLIGQAVRAAAGAARPARAAAVGGARRGDQRAADRVRARGRDPAPAHRRARHAAARTPACATRPPPAPSPAPRPRGSPPSTCAGPRADAAPGGGEVAPGRVDLSPPTTCRPGGGCARSRASARGRSRCSRSRARAATTRSRRATSATSSSSAASRPATRGRARTIAEVRGFFEPYGECKGLAGEYLRAAAAPRLLPSVLRDPSRVEPLARQELVRQRPSRAAAA